MSGPFYTFMYLLLLLLLLAPLFITLFFFLSQVVDDDRAVFRGGLGRGEGYGGKDLCDLSIISRTSFFFFTPHLLFSCLYEIFSFSFSPLSSPH